MDLSPEPDLKPLYPNPADIDALLSQHSGLAPAQKAELVHHCLSRACLFGDLSVLTYLLSDRQAQNYVDLGVQDDDGLGFISLTIHGFGSDSERDVEREECVRFLVAQGADVNAADKSGWTPLHHAALLSPPTLISYLMTHGANLFAETRRKLTALDIVTAHSILPGREDIALLLEEAMRGEGWSGGRMEERRRVVDERIKRKTRQKTVREDVGKVLDVSPKWWGNVDSEMFFADSDSDSDEEDEGDTDESVYTPPVDYSSMLVFSPPALPQIFDSVIINFQPSLRNAQPANTLYLLARFACLTCDHTWLEDLIIGATDAIEETFFNRPDDVTCLTFWLYNTTMWLHLMQCDKSINEACEMLGSFELIEEVINSVFVFIIRFAERRIDQLLDSAILDHAPLPGEFDSVQFESEWSFLRTFTAKKKGNAPANPPPASVRGGTPSSPPAGSRPPSPSPSQPPTSSTSKGGFASLRQSFARARAPTTTTPLQALFPDAPPPPSPTDITTFLTALHTLLTLGDINPAFTTQLWSQVMYWTSCEIFNRVLTRKKYLCRSRALQIGMNLSVLEDWVGEMGLPEGIESHFVPVRELLNWLQCLSSITEFSVLVSTVQAMKNVNPLQMRRAVRDYKYEVNEGRMTDECVQYLTQLQKDWERHRVKLGVEALRKEIGDRDRDREESVTSSMNDVASTSVHTPSIISTVSSDTSIAQQHIDMLFDRDQEKSSWEPAKPPQVLGELLDSRYMLPLLLPSDPRMLAALPAKPKSPHGFGHTRSASRTSSRHRGPMGWRSQNKKIRDVGVETLQWVDGIRSASRWGRPVEGDDESNADEGRPMSPEYPDGDHEHEHDSTEDHDNDTVSIHITPLTRKPSTARPKGRASINGGDTTPVEASS
ncbi:hypothetical protein PLICRDRAFT_49881 [Plicaturopsis crispa FD-325 SS-3]|nr:hypothetical protein PLICRDRAFT_49881 [Plicaturopsis crispa FD-325 SS-3]